MTWVAGITSYMAKSPMDKDDAARIQSAAARNPDSDSRQEDFDRRAQSAADRNEAQGQDQDDEDD
ncbi:hypothetical protein AB0C84_21045 [Actinomadura sp. NPDC048955]|uniref:hypothetical protein n=1 Tax=Actinomadura sp. NPDC048955 TaxID=3158228 RepID=UPI0033E9F124